MKLLDLTPKPTVFILWYLDEYGFVQLELLRV